MKISKKKLAHWVREIAKAFQYPLALLAVVITASLVPGDRVDISTAGWVVGMVILALTDAAVCIPLLLLAKRLEKDVLEPVPVRNEW